MTGRGPTSQAVDLIARLPPDAFRKADPSPDVQFYAEPRFVAHIDDAAIAAVTQVYRETLPPGGAILDVMSSWISHLPSKVSYASVVGHGMNRAELAANPRLSRWLVQDLNADPVLPLDTGSFDGACLCVSVQYLQRPVQVFADLARVLRPGAPLIVSFSNRCFPTKAVAVWQSLRGADQQRLVAAYMEAAGFADRHGRVFAPEAGDPVWVVIGRTETYQLRKTRSSR